MGNPGNFYWIEVTKEDEQPQAIPGGEVEQQSPPYSPQSPHVILIRWSK
jgi:hypothetical protein